MSDSDFALRLAPPSELREMVQTLTRERDEARRLHMGQAGRAAGWRARARYAREALERLIELVADDPEAKDTTTPLCWAVTVARAEVTAIEEAERRDADRSTPHLELTVREAARQRVPLDGADAQALEGALALTERERDEARELWRREETRMREAEWALDAAGVSATAPMPPGVAGCQTFSVAERIGTLAAQRDEARAEVERLRAALAGEGEALDRAHTVDVDLCTVHAVDMQPAPVDEHQVNKTRMLRFRLRQGEPLYICLTQGRQIVIKVDPRYGGAGEEPTHTPTPEKARQP